jgi:hypothetical protein
MKKIILIMAVIAFIATAQKSTAQVRFNVNLNIGTQPDWGPAGYDHAEYYYLPDIDVYYYVPQRQFVYFSNGRWVFGAFLPAWYRSYDLYNSYKVVINEPRPYLHHEAYSTRYAMYKGLHGRQSNNRNDDRYRSYNGRENNNDRGHDNGGHDNRDHDNRGHGNRGHGNH